MNINPDAQSDQPTAQANDTTQIPAQIDPTLIPTKPEKTEPSRVRRFWRRLLIILVVLEIALVGGKAIDHYLRYKPVVEELHKAQATI